MKKMNLNRGLHVRPSRPEDNPFIEQLHRSTRTDLHYIEGEQEFIESIIEMQFRAQSQGYGDAFPNAMYFIVEQDRERIGKVTIDFGHNEIRIIDVAFIPQARGKGLGEEIFRCLQTAAMASGSPLTLSVLTNNLVAKSLYVKLGFTLERSAPPYDLMVWYPAANRVYVGDTIA